MIYKDENENIIELVGGESRECAGIFLKIIGSNNYIKFYEGTIFENCSIMIGSNNHISIGKSQYKICNLKIHTNNFVRCSIGENFTCLGCEIRLQEDKTEVTIGNECMFSKEITFYPTDGHAIYDYETKKILNLGKPIHIGNHVWIGRRVSILKGVSISDNSIVGIGSIVTKQFLEENVIISGIPARIIKRKVCWQREPPELYERLRCIRLELKNKN